MLLKNIYENKNTLNNLRKFLNLLDFRVFCQKEMHSEKKGGILLKRKELHTLRQEIQVLVEEGIYIHTLLAQMTEKLRQFFANFIEECIQLLGPPKTAYAFIGLGSMSRWEMCPYSDLEFAILIENSTEENKIYFKICSICKKNIYSYRQSKTKF